jgi:hypothetical protein
VKVIESIESLIGKRPRASTAWTSEDPVEVVLVAFIFLGFILITSLSDCGFSEAQMSATTPPPAVLDK